MYGNREPPQNYVQGFQPHPGAATYFFEDPQQQYMFYSAPGAVGGEPLPQPNYYVPQAGDYQNQQEMGYSSSTTHNPTNPGQPSSEYNKHFARHMPREQRGHKGLRHRGARSNYRGGYRENYSSAHSYSNDVSENYEGIESRENSHDSNRYHSQSNFANNGESHASNVMYGEGYYKNQYINKARNMRTERQKENRTDIPENHLNAKKNTNTRDSGNDSNTNFRGNRRHYANENVGYSDQQNSRQKDFQNSKYNDLQSSKYKDTRNPRYNSSANSDDLKSSKYKDTRNSRYNSSANSSNFQSSKYKDTRNPRYNSSANSKYHDSTDSRCDYSDSRCNDFSHTRNKNAQNYRNKDAPNNYEDTSYRKHSHTVKYMNKKVDRSRREPPTSSSSNELEKSTQLRNGTYECNVCLEKIIQKDPIWSCQTCYNSFHLTCVTKWIRNSIKDEEWRCPACNSVQTEKVAKYLCFCRKVLNPHWTFKETPHSCGQLCKKKRGHSWCVHGCPDLCHPGACPPCAAFTKRSCACGKLLKSLRCSDSQDLLCDNICDKTLNCGVHQCTKPCHTDDCLPCDNSILKTCYCGKSETAEDCTVENASEEQYSCEEICNKTLRCGIHTCQSVCHSGDCISCNREVDIITHCPCGKRPLNAMKAPARTSCADAIQTCGQVCGRRLKCGNPGKFHECTRLCHEGTCPPCAKVTAVKCRCGSMNAQIPCVELRVKSDEVTCKKPCKKWRHCGRHKCGLKCCIEEDHLCTKICNQMLACKLHRCEDLCHRGKCKRCLRSSFDELTCHCGFSVMHPPIQCGSEPPLCDQPCVRSRTCDHNNTHKCHQGVCPPCTILAPKSCSGDHKIMKTTPCYISSLSCGSLCQKTLSCSVHKCQKVCHEGDCQPEKKCVQICQKPRTLCGHPCGAKCHKNSCPILMCKVKVSVSCICGTRQTVMLCSQNEKEFQTIFAAQLASRGANTGDSVDLSALFGNGNQDKVKRLECDEECRMKERNQRLALALQITNPEARDKLGDSSRLYSDLLKEDAKRDYQFTSMVHDQLNDLVMRAKESTQRSRSYSFAPMNRDKRRFIHEYSKHFGCESKSYDEEPKKNVVITATKGVCMLPPVSVLTIVQREAGTRKVPGPYLNKIPKSSSEISLKKLEKSNSQEKRDEEMQNTSKQFDYFDME